MQHIDRHSDLGERLGDDAAMQCSVTRANPATAAPKGARTAVRSTEVSR